nr:UDP-N-acetylglucosamine--N-acetylmuramyl-(pentapeptide) pyrophosphoryl-undecaprenol N-acetylglucosamine transferase [Alphaproteobacteria bacterium]
MSAPSGTVQVVLAAGGTGGHLFPAEALADALLSRGVGVALLTDRRGTDFTGALGRIETRGVTAAGVAGRGLRGKLASLFLLARGTLQARRRLRHWRPDVVVGFGGYPSVPTVLAAQLLGIDTVIHEQNALIGRANRLLMGRAKRIATSFARIDRLPERLADRVVVTGNPVRPAFQAARNAPYPAQDGPIRLLVLGGSQGASAFATLIPQAVEALPAEIRRRLEITQQCRADDLEQVRATYEAMGVPATLAAFINDVPDRLAASHLLIARAGAST